MNKDIVFFKTEDQSITLPVQITADTVWLNRNQLLSFLEETLKR